MKQFLLTAVLVLFLSAPAHAKSVVQVQGMVCDFCAQALNKVFLEKEGVKELDVNLDDQTVTIHYEDDATPLDEETVKELIYYAGYEFIEIKED